FYDQRTFFCQQAAEKYLKALLEDLAQPVPRTHVLDDLINLLLPYHRSLGGYRRGVRFLTRFAVGPRYPGDNATRRQAKAARRGARGVRPAARTILGLPLAPPRRRK